LYLPRPAGGIEEVRTVTDSAHGISRTLRTEVDALGETVREVASDGGVTTHGRDSLGRVVWTDGPLPGPVDRIGIAYTVTGHRTEVVDPDKGTWRYAVNGFGEVTCQLDAKGQAHWHRYDVCVQPRTPLTRRFQEVAGFQCIGSSTSRSLLLHPGSPSAHR
jgi:YD repeat-containing protein